MSYINKKGKDRAWRKHAISNLVADVLLYNRVETSQSMAKYLTRLLAKLIGWAKEDTLHSRRLALRYLVNKKHLGVVNKLFTEIRDKYKDRKGGYSRITKLNYRVGDNNLRVVFALV